MNFNKMPKVNIVIPTYNRPDVLKRCLEHVRELSYQPYEVIYQYRMNRNHMYMLIKNYGFFSKITLLYLTKSTFRDIYKNIGRIAKAIITLFLITFAKIMGTFSGIFYILKRKK